MSRKSIVNVFHVVAVTIAVLVPTGLSPAVARADARCEHSGAPNPYGAWEHPIRFRIGVESFPIGLKEPRNRVRTWRRIQGGGAIWSQVRTPCPRLSRAPKVDIAGIVDNVGETQYDAGVIGDRISAIDFVDPGTDSRWWTERTSDACDGAIACARRKMHPDDDTRIIEFDARFHSQEPWWNQISSPKGRGAYDLWSVTAHEIGHGIGMRHNNSSPYNIMWPSSCFGSDSADECGPIGFVRRNKMTVGDWNAFNKAYP
jgi:hypothetical protein